jgi:hypothetical protein
MENLNDENSTASSIFLSSVQSPIITDDECNDELLIIDDDNRSFQDLVTGPLEDDGNQNERKEKPKQNTIPCEKQNTDVQHQPVDDYQKALKKRIFKLSDESLIKICSKPDEFKDELLKEMKKRKKYNHIITKNDFNFFERAYVHGITKLKVVSVNHFPCNAAICDTTVKNRFDFLGMKKRKKESIVEKVRDELGKDRGLMMDCIRVILDDFFVFRATKEGIRNSDGTYCQNLKHINKAFQKCETVNEAKRFWHVFYDFVNAYPNWQLETAASSMITLRWMYDKEEIMNTNLFTFAEKCVTFVLTVIRKSLNSSGKQGLPGFSLTNYLMNGIRDNNDEDYDGNKFCEKYIVSMNVSNS